MLLCYGAGMTTLILSLQASMAIFMFFVANLLTSARFFPAQLHGLYGVFESFHIISPFFTRMLVLSLPIYAVGILMLADAFNKNASLTSPVLLFANVLAAIVVAIALDGVPVTWKVLAAFGLCVCAEFFLYYALQDAKAI